jgi:hypothetical protein
MYRELFCACKSAAFQTDKSFYNYCRGRDQLLQYPFLCTIIVYICLNISHMKNILLFFSIFFSSWAFGQMVGPDAYLKGLNVEVGIDGSKGHEGVYITASPPLPGMHHRSGTNFFGFVANPQLDGWLTQDGDFFTPGTPENGWGLELDTLELTSNCAKATVMIPGAISSWTYSGISIESIWEGDATSATDLHCVIKYHLEDSDLFYTTEVTIVNNTTGTIPELFYYRNFDPDNNQPISGDYTTQNTILNQYTSGTSSFAHVSATSSLPASQPTSYVALLAIDTLFRASVGGFANRDGSDLYNGGGLFHQTVGYTSFQDEAISLAYKVENLAAADSATFKFATLFSPSAVACAIHALGMDIQPVAPIPLNSYPQHLTGVPAGGEFSGPGVTNDSIDPVAAGEGDHTIYYTVTDTITGCTNTVSTVVTVYDNMTTSITETVTEQIAIYPNPSDGQTRIDLTVLKDRSNASVQIFDVSGRIVYNKVSPDESITLDAGYLNPGIYIVQLLDNGVVVAKEKLIIQK